MRRIRLAHLLALSLTASALASCSPAPRDILVVWRNGQLVIDFPWSIWRLVGLQDRDYCIQRIDLFDGQRVLWTATMQEEGPTYHSCFDVKMPLVLGSTPNGFVARGNYSIKANSRYGVAIDGIGAGRVDFIAKDKHDVLNFTDSNEQMERLVGLRFGTQRRSPLEPR